MADERIDIIVEDKVSDGPEKKIRALGAAARIAHSEITTLKSQLSTINATSVRKLQEELTRQTTQTTRQAAALERLTAAQARTDAAMASATRQQTRAAVETERLALMTQRVTTEQQRTVAVTDRAAAAREKLALASARNTASMDKEGDAAAKLYRQVDALRTQQRSTNAQESFNAALGVTTPSSGSARASSRVFEQDARDKALAAKETENLTARANALRAAIDPLAAAQQRFNREVAEATALRRAGAISEASYTQAVNMSTQAMNLATNANKRMGDATKLNRFQVLTLQYTINDVIASLASGASPFTILAQQGGQVTQAWGGFGNTMKAVGAAMVTPVGLFVVLAAAVTGGLVVLDSANSEFKKLGRQLDSTAGSAGLTAGQFVVMADQIAASTKTSISSNREIAMAFSQTGQLQRQEIEQFTVVTQNFAKLTSQSTDAVVKSFTQAVDAPTKFAKNFTDQYGVLTVKQYEYIRGLEEAGRKVEATAALSKVLYDYYGTQAPQNLSKAATAWNIVGKAIADAMTNFKSFITTAPTAEMEIASLEKSIASMRDSLNKPSSFIGDTTTARQAELSDALALLATKKEGVRIGDRASAQRAEAVAQEKEAIAATDRLNGLTADIADNSAKATRDIAKFRNDLEIMSKREPNSATYLNALKNQAAIEKGIRDKNMPDAKKDGKKEERLAETRVLSLARVNSELDKETNSLGMVSQARDAQRKADEIEIQLAAKKIVLSNAERAAIERKVAAVVAGAQQQAALNQAYEAATGPLRNYTNALAATGELQAQGLITGAEMLRQQALAKEHYLTQIDPLREINRGLKEQADLSGFVGRAREVEAQMQQAVNAARQNGKDLNSAAMTTERDALRSNIEATLKKKELGDEINAQYEATVGKLNNLKVKEVALTQAYERGYIGLTKYGEGLRELQAETFTINTAMGTDTFTDRMAEAFNRNIGSMEDALKGFLMTGKLDVKTFVQSVLADFTMLEIRKNVTGPLSAAGGIGGLFKMGASLFGGGGAGAFTADAGLVANAADYGAAIGLPSYAVGTPFVPRDMVANIHKGERILTEKENKSYSKQAGGAITISSNPTIQIDSRADAAQVQDMVYRGVQAGNAQLINELQIAGRL